MSSNFLHEDKNVPPDETVERDAPVCDCGQQMWLVRVETQLSDSGSRSIRKYECTRCGHKQLLRLSEPIAPSPA
jgi:DNA-directed RNA polymerase subunit RPC12/RpoP